MLVIQLICFSYTVFPLNCLQVHAALGDLDAAFRILLAGSRAQASANDGAALEFLQPPHIDLEALGQDQPRGSPQAAAQVSFACPLHAATAHSGCCKFRWLFLQFPVCCIWVAICCIADRH